MPSAAAPALAALWTMFFLYSVCGWVIESTYCSIPARRFVNRGFLNGPYIPIYGIGSMIAVLLLGKLKGTFTAIVAGIALRLDPLSWAIVLLCCGVVIAGELLNTAVETIIDLVSPEFHPLAGRAKDIAAAAVWSLSVFVALAGTIVYANALMRLLS